MDRDGVAEVARLGANLVTIGLICVLIAAAIPAAALLSWYDFGRTPQQEAVDTITFWGALGYCAAGVGILLYALLGRRKLAALVGFGLLTLVAAGLCVLKVIYFG